jgi:hypothetical protein
VRPSRSIRCRVARRMTGSDSAGRTGVSLTDTYLFGTQVSIVFASILIQIGPAFEYTAARTIRISRHLRSQTTWHTVQVPTSAGVHPHANPKG